MLINVKHVKKTKTIVLLVTKTDIIHQHVIVYKVTTLVTKDVVNVATNVLNVQVLKYVKFVLINNTEILKIVIVFLDIMM